MVARDIISQKHDSNLKPRRISSAVSMQNNTERLLPHNGNERTTLKNTAIEKQTSKNSQLEKLRELWSTTLRALYSQQIREGFIVFQKYIRSAASLFRRTIKISGSIVSWYP